jgi:hypothetical protein
VWFRGESVSAAVAGRDVAAGADDTGDAAALSARPEPDGEIRDAWRPLPLCVLLIRLEDSACMRVFQLNVSRYACQSVTQAVVRPFSTAL